MLQESQRDMAPSNSDGRGFDHVVSVGSSRGAADAGASDGGISPTVENKSFQVDKKNTEKVNIL